MPWDGKQSGPNSQESGTLAIKILHDLAFARLYDLYAVVVTV